MPLTEKQVEVIKQHRSAFNDAIERNSNVRSERVAHALSISSDFHIAMLTISLGLGAAIVPLVLLGESLKSEDSIFLVIASTLLLSNSIYLSLVLKNRTEDLSIGATITGIEERVSLVKLRNLLTKAIVTKDEKYFTQYNNKSRLIAEDAVKVLQEAKWSNLDYSTDICVSVLVLAAFFVLKPILPIENTIYFHLVALILLLLIWWFVRQNDKYNRLNNKAKKLNAEGVSEEESFNKFVKSLASKEKE